MSARLGPDANEGRRRWSATIRSTSSAWRETNAGPTPWISARASTPPGREAAIASRVRLWATV